MTVNGAADRSLDVGGEVLGENLSCIISTHIDDIKGSGDQKVRDSLLAALKRDYGGDVKMEKGEFEHTGIMHKQNADFSIYTSQDHYVKEISEISLTKVNTDKAF